MSKGNTVKYDLDPKRTKGLSEETRKRLDALTDEEIEAAIAQDPDAVPLSEADFEHEGRTHHFISQAEQRFNAREYDKNKIYKFEVIERGPPITKCPPVLRRTNDRGMSIRSNLAFDDLFTFDRSGATGRNFERLFAAYENDIHQAVSDLMVQVEARAEENLGRTLLKIITLKFLNVWRNPFGVRKFLNTFKVLQDYQPSERHIRDLFNRINALSEADLPSALRQSSLSLPEHQAWLKDIFLLLLPSGVRDPKNPQRYLSILEEWTHDLLTNPNRFRAIELQLLSKDSPGRFLLNDRSYFYGSESSDRSMLKLHFNITDHIALNFMIVDPEIVYEHIVKRDPDVAQFDRQIVQESQAEVAEAIQFRVVKDDFDHLKRFNEMMILQAHKHVYCSQKDVYGIKVLGPRTKQHTK